MTDKPRHPIAVVAEAMAAVHESKPEPYAIDDSAVAQLEVALATLNVDAPPSAEMLEELRAEPGFEWVRLVLL